MQKGTIGLNFGTSVATGKVVEVLEKRPRNWKRGRVGTTVSFPMVEERRPKKDKGDGKWAVRTLSTEGYLISRGY